MVTKIDCVARIRTKRLADAFRRTAKGKLRVLQTKRGVVKYVQEHSQPAVWFHEVSEEPDSQTEMWFPGANYYVSASMRQHYTLRSFCPTLLMIDTPKRLVDSVCQLIDDLSSTASQRILAVRVSGRQILSVTFFDGKTFELKLESHQLQERVTVDPDRRYLIVPRLDRVVDTIPWDAIRQPKALLDDRQNACNALATALRRLREDAGLSQIAAAEKSGLTRQTVIRLEKAGQYPGLATLDALAAAYGVTTRDILAAAQQEAA